MASRAHASSNCPPGAPLTPIAPRYLKTLPRDKQRGANPAELPAEQPTRLELVVNIKTAKTLGIKIPNSILVRTDGVID